MVITEETLKVTQDYTIPFTEVKKIHVRLEGGLGDHLLGVRFLPAIREKHPNAKIHIFTDTEGKPFQSFALKSAYSHLFDSIEVIPSKKHKEFWVDCQFGTDNFYGALENVPDDIRERMVNDCDKFYDLHIDGLKWMQADFEWLRYFYFFPKPRIDNVEDFVEAFKLKKDAGRYVVMHLHSATSVGHRLEPFYVEGLVKKVAEFVPVVIIATEETKNLYPTGNNISVFVGPVDSVFKIIAGASAMVSTDSGFRYIAYGAGIPTITFSANCMAPEQCLSHEIRWLLFTKQIVPLNYSFTFVAKSVKNILDNKGYALVPFVKNFDMELVNRVYTINKTRTV